MTPGLGRSVDGFSGKPYNPGDGFPGFGGRNLSSFVPAGCVFRNCQRVFLSRFRPEYCDERFVWAGFSHALAIGRGVHRILQSPARLPRPLPRGKPFPNAEHCCRATLFAEIHHGVRQGSVSNLDSPNVLGWTTGRFIYVFRIWVHGATQVSRDGERRCNNSSF